MTKRHVDRRLTAILAADVAGYSRLMGADEEGTHAQLKAHRHDLIDRRIKKHRGHIINTAATGCWRNSPVRLKPCDAQSRSSAR